MRSAATTVILIGMLATSLSAQGRGRASSQGIPPGHLPPPGACRVWYDGQPPGRQPPPTDCREAERIAARNRSARVIYGVSDAATRPRAVPRPERVPFPSGSYPSSRGPYSPSGYRYVNVAFDNGYNDGLEKGREDARDRDAYDPNRHGRYRSGERGYDRRYGAKEEYRALYREGFRAGYDNGYRQTSVYGSNRSPLRWQRLPSF